MISFSLFILFVFVVKDLSNLHSKRLMVNFEADEAAQEREIELVTAEVTQIFRHAEALLKKFSKIGDESGASQAELKVRANMQKSVAKRLQTLSMAFRSSQKVRIPLNPNNKGILIRYQLLVGLFISTPISESRWRQ